MQLSNACGSGCILALGTGSKVMLYAIPTFILGSLLGSFWVPSFLALGSFKTSFAPPSHQPCFIGCGFVLFFME